MTEIIPQLILEIIKKIENHRGISEFIKNLSKFEGWLKVELIDSAIKLNCSEVIPEKNFVDVTFKYKTKSYALELKTINTNYQTSYNKKTRPITKNIQGIIEDINALKKKEEYNFKYVLFIVFPLDLELDEKLWKRHLTRIESLTKLNRFAINFLENRKGMLYIGEVK